MAKARRRRRSRAVPQRVARGVPVAATPEVVARRAYLAGPGGDPALTTCTLDLLHTRGCLTEPQQRAGLRYAYLRRVLYGAGTASAAGAVPGNPLPEDRIVKLRAEFDRLSAALHDAGRRAKTAVDNAAVYDRWPGWFRATLAQRIPRRGDREERTALLVGLDSLAVALGLIRAGRCAA